MTRGPVFGLVPRWREKWLNPRRGIPGEAFTSNDVGHLVQVFMGSRLEDSFINLQDKIEIKSSAPQPANLEGGPF